MTTIIIIFFKLNIKMINKYFSCKQEIKKKVCSCYILDTIQLPFPTKHSPHLWLPQHSLVSHCFFQSLQKHLSLSNNFTYIIKVYITGSIRGRKHFAISMQTEAVNGSLVKTGQCCRQIINRGPTVEEQRTTATFWGWAPSSPGLPTPLCHQS